MSLQSPVFLFAEQELAQGVLTSYCLILPLCVFLWDSGKGKNDWITQLRGHWELGKPASFWPVLPLKEGKRAGQDKHPEAFSQASVSSASPDRQMCAVPVTATCFNSDNSHIIQCCVFACVFCGSFSCKILARFILCHAHMNSKSICLLYNYSAFIHLFLYFT